MKYLLAALLMIAGCGCLTTEDVVKHAPKPRRVDPPYDHDRFDKLVHEMAAKEIEQLCNEDIRLARLHTSEAVGGIRSWYPIRSDAVGTPNIIMYMYDFADGGTVRKYVWLASKDGKTWDWALFKSVSGPPPQPKQPKKAM